MTCIKDNIHKYLYSKKPNYYTILNLNQVPTPSHEDIRRAYLKLSKIYHPDKCKDVHANELFNLITTAYQTLINNVDTFDDKLLVHTFLKNIIDDKYTDLYTKMLLKPDELNLMDIITLGYSFYKIR